MEPIAEFSVRTVLFQLPVAAHTRRTLFIVNGSPLKAEDVIRQYFRDHGWWICLGGEAAYFFYTMSQLPVIAGNTPHEDVARALHRSVRKYAYTSKSETYKQLAEQLYLMDAADLQDLVLFFADMACIPRGVPDIFAIRSGEYEFAEVKSRDLQLDAEQQYFFRKFVTQVSDRAAIYRVQPPRRVRTVPYSPGIQRLRAAGW
jgi:hypothetical protein